MLQRSIEDLLRQGEALGLSWWNPILTLMVFTGSLGALLIKGTLTQVKSVSVIRAAKDRPAGL